MRWLARLKPLVAVAATLIFATAGVAVQERQQPAPGTAREQAKTAPSPTPGAGGAAVPDLAANRALARKQLALIDNALQSLQQEYRNPRAGTTSFAHSSFSLWERRKLEALRRAGAGKAEIVAAIEKLIDILNGEETIAKAQLQAARGSLLDVFDAQFRRMEAEMWLNEEKAR